MRDLTTGSVTRHLLKTTSFMLVTMVFQTLYFLADLYWVGRLGTEAVAAVAVAANLTFVVLAATQMLGVGTTTLVSHAAGRKDQPRANAIFNQSVILGAVLGLMFFAASVVGLQWYVAVLSADAATAVQAEAYLAWFIPAMALQFPTVSMSAALRGTGHFTPGMIVQTSSVVLNIVLTPMLMFGWPVGPALGITGAALATFVSVVIGAVWLSLYFAGRTAYLHVRTQDWRPQLRLWRDLLNVGLPAGAEFALMAVYLVVVYIVIRPFGAAAQAGFGIGLRVMQGCFLPVVALGLSAAAVGGQNFGARLASRVRETVRSAALIAAASMGVAAVACALLAPQMIAFFSDDAAVIAVGAEYLRIVAVNFVGSGLVFVSSSMFQALGNTVPPLLASCGRLLLVAVPALLLSRRPGFQLAWIWYLSAGTVWVQMSINLLLLKRELARRLDTPSVIPRAAV